jgi:hypothetical protein
MKLVAGMMLNESAFWPGYSDSHELDEISRERKTKEIKNAARVVRRALDR